MGCVVLAALGATACAGGTDVALPPSTVAAATSSSAVPASPSSVSAARSTSATAATTAAAGPSSTGPQGPAGRVAPGRFATLPPGAALPDDATCAALVTPADEIRAVNAPFNARRGAQKNLSGPYLGRVTGDFTGTTDEILQWVSCKWGIDTDIVRAQAAKESYWRMIHVGDWSPNPDVCAPGRGIGVDGRDGECPESFGMLQVRWQYAGPPAGFDTWPEVVESTAYHVDYTYAYWRSCYEGTLTWLNTTDRVGEYAAGDEWGCVGIWFAGRWRTSPAEEYIAAVQDYVRRKIWTTRDFIRFKD